MAYYIKDSTKTDTEYTARRDISCYPTQGVFRDHVYSWLNERNIQYTWSGHGASQIDGISTMFLTVSIPNRYDATLFMVAWS
jgi:hypothetical protein